MQTQQPPRLGGAHDLNPGVHRQLAVEALDLGADGGHPDAQPLCDLLVVVPPGHQAQHVDFAFGQRRCWAVQPGRGLRSANLFEQHACQQRRNLRPTFVDVLDRLDQLALAAALEYIAGKTRALHLITGLALAAALEYIAGGTRLQRMDQPRLVAEYRKDQ